jgi:TonB family protein
MAPLPPLTPNPPEPSGVRVPSRTRSEVFDDTIWQSDAGLIFVKLRKMIASDTQSTETILGAIAVAAHALTGGTGAAVAMPRDGVVVCVGRSGETAPELGDRLNVDSGISGECLRTGVIMRCDDASRDFHVNAEVCRQLGLQSIAVVPLRGQFGRVGVLEAFSSESHAFNEDKMEILGRLAGLAEAAWARGAVIEAPAVEDNKATTEISAVVNTVQEPEPTAAFLPVIAPVASPFPPITPAEAPSATAILLDQVREALAPQEDFGVRKQWRIVAIAASVLLAVVLLSVYGWREWYKASVTSQTSHPAASAVSAPTEGGDAASGLAGRSEVMSPAARSGRSAAAHSSKATASTEFPDEIIHRQFPAARSPDRGIAKGDSQSNSATNADEPPLIEASSPDPPDLGNAMAPAPALPSLSVPISQGVAGGVLIHKVQPVYPAEARRMHVEGSVVIDAIVTVDGQVDQMHLVSGDPRLAPAALEAIRQWRYTPYSLNGKPIPKQTRITISFLAPQ